MIDKIKNLLYGPSYKDLSQYFAQLSMLITCGYSFAESNGFLTDSQNNKILKEVLRKVQINLNHGDDVKTAFSKTRFFSPYVISMLGMSDEKIVDMCHQISEYMFKAHKIKQCVRSAMTQPIIIFFLFVVLVQIMNSTLLPSIITIYENNGGEMPATVIFFVNYIRPLLNNMYILILILIVMFYVFNKTLNKDGLILSRFLNKLPIIGTMRRLIFLEQFVSTFALIIKNEGTTSLAALKLMSENTSNILAAQILKNTTKLMQGKGISMYQALYQANEGNMFSKDLLLYIKIGEESSKLQENMQHAAKFYQNDIEYQINTLSNKLTYLMYVPIVLSILYFAMLLIGSTMGLSSNLIDQYILN